MANCRNITSAHIYPGIIVVRFQISYGLAPRSLEYGALDPELVVSIAARCHQTHKNLMTHVRHRTVRLFVRPFTEPPSHEKNAIDSTGDPLILGKTLLLNVVLMGSCYVSMSVTDTSGHERPANDTGHGFNFVCERNHANGYR